MTASTPIEPVIAADGWGVLHLFHRVDREKARALSPGAVKAFTAMLEELHETTQVHLFSTFGHKADMMTMLIDEDWSKLRAAQTAIESSEVGAALVLEWSYLSMTEESEYTTTSEQYRAEMAQKVDEPERLDRMVEEFEERMAAYRSKKVHPKMPRWQNACFYPMTHRREGADNWYLESFDRRKEMMNEHGRSGRAYTGRVVQLVTASTGLDDWEFGVTLFAHDIGDLREIVYELRYDEASSRFGEFGPFVVGMRREPGQLAAELGLPSA